MRNKENPPPEPLKLEEIEKIADAADQARAASDFMIHAEHQRSRGMAIRDTAIRRLRAATNLTIPEIAAAAETSVGTVKAVLR